MATNWFLDYLEEERKRVKPGTPLTPEQRDIAANMPKARSKAEKPAAPPPLPQAAMGADRGMVRFMPPSPLFPGVTGPARLPIDMLDAAAMGLKAGVGGLTKNKQLQAEAAAQQEFVQSQPRGPISSAFVQAAPSLPAMFANMIPYAGPAVGAGLMAGQTMGHPSKWDLPPETRLKSAGAQGGIEYLGMLPEYALLMSGLGPVAKAGGMFASNLLTEPIEEGLQGVTEASIERGMAPTLSGFMRSATEALPATLAMSAIGGGMGALAGRQQPGVREAPPRVGPGGQLELPMRTGFGRGENATLNHVVRTALKTLEGNDWAGATVNARHGDMAGKRAVATAAVPEAEAIIDGKATQQQIKAYVRENWPLLRHEQMDLGVWFNAQNGKTYLDVTTTPDNFEAAQNMARMLKAEGRGKPEGEIAGFNLETFEELPYTYPPETPPGEEQELFGQPPMGPVIFNQQTPNWAPYTVPGSEEQGLQSSQPGGHHITIAPAKGKWVIENYGSKWASAPTMEEARAKAEQLIAGMPTVSAERTAEAQAAQALHPADADLGVLEGEAALRNMGPAATVTMPQPQRPVEPPMTPEEQRMADMLAKAEQTAKKELVWDAMDRAAAAKVQAQQAEMPQDVVAKLTPLEIKKADLPFPVWDFTKTRVLLPDAGNELLVEEIRRETEGLPAFTSAGRDPTYLNRVLDLAYSAGESAYVPPPVRTVELDTAIRWLKSTDPDYLNMILSRAVSAYYGDRGAWAMLQMELASPDPRTVNLLEELDESIKKSPFVRAAAVGEEAYNAVDLDQPTLSPLGEVPPLLRLKTQRELADIGIDANREWQEEVRARQNQEAFPDEVMNPRLDSFITRMVQAGMRPDPTGQWAVYENDEVPNSGRRISFPTREAAEAHVQKFLDNPDDKIREQIKNAVVAPYFTPSPSAENPNGYIDNKLNAAGGYQYQGRGTGWSGRIGHRQITDEAVHEFFAGAARQGHFTVKPSRDTYYWERWWKKENMSVWASPKQIMLKLHGNTIARYDRENGDLELRDAGWQTPTTKERLNGILEAIHFPGRIYQHKFKWYYEDGTGTTKRWDGSLLIPGVTRRDTGTFAMQQPNELLPAYNMLNTAEPRPVQPVPPEQMTLPGISPSVREVKVTGTQKPVFTQGNSMLTGSVEKYPPGSVLRLFPKSSLYADERRQAGHDLIAAALDWAKEHNIPALVTSEKFATEFAEELQYEMFHRGMSPPLENFYANDGTVLFTPQVESKGGWGEQTLRPEQQKATTMPPVEGVSDDFFKQVSPKFDIPTISWLGEGRNMVGQYGEVLGHGMRPFAQPERQRVMAMLEGLERIGLPPLLVNRLKGIGGGSYSNPGNLAQVDIANDVLSVSQESIAQMMRGEAEPEVMQSVAHELGHLASIVYGENGEPQSYLARSPLFRWDSRSGKMYALTGNAPPSAFGSVMKEIMDVGLRGEGVLGEMMRYPVQTAPAYDDAFVFKVEAFAQIWSAYYLMPEVMAEQMPLSYNLMRELSQYANTSKTFDEWMDRLRIGLQTAVNEPKLRKKLLDREVVKPFQATFFHTNVAGTDIQPVVDKSNLTPEEQGFFERYVRGNEERVLAARRGVQNGAAIDQQAVAYVREMSDLAKHLNMTLPDLMKKRGGIAMSSAELMAGKGLLSEAVRQVQAKAEAAKMQNADEGTVADFVESFKGLQLITDEFFRARAEWGRAGQVLQRQAVDFAEAMNLVSKAGGMTGAKDLAYMVSTLDPSQQAAFAQAAKKKTRWDQAWGVWYSFMLSNPKTHIVNFTSNAIYNQWLGLDRLVAAGLGKLHGGDKVYFKEMVPTLHGLAQGTLDAIAHSRDYLMTGGEQGKWDIPGAETERLGPTNLIPRMMGAGDAFFHSVAFHQELRHRALRQAISEGLKGDALYQREEYIRTHPDEFKDIFRRAERFARKATFTEELTPWFKRLEGLRSERTAPMASGLTRLTVPFLRTIVNLTKQGARHTPGLSAAVPAWRADIKAGGAARDIAVAENLTGAGLLTLGWLLAEMGLGEGAEPPDPKEAMAWRMENLPVSVKLGDQQVGLNRIDPLASLYGIGASIPMIADSDDKMGAAMEVAKELMLSKSWMIGLEDFFGAMQSYSPEEGEAKVYRWMGGIASTAMPAIMGEVARNMDPYARKQQAEGPEGRFMGRTPLLREQLAPSVDVKGNLIPAQEFLGPNFISPFPSKQVGEPDPVLAEMMRVHAVPANLKGTSKTGKLDTHTQTLYQQTARQIAWPILENLIYSDEYIDAEPDEQKEKIEKVLKKANAQARKEIFE